MTNGPLSDKSALSQREAWRQLEEAWHRLGDTLFPPETNGLIARVGGIEPIALRPLDAAKAIGVGRTEMFHLVGNGSIPSFKVGKMRLVAVADLRAWVDAQRVWDRGR